MYSSNRTKVIFSRLMSGACPNCRLQALRFAQEAAPHIQAILDDSTMPCHCFNTLAYHLENVHKQLDQFLQERAFDLYFQSPWYLVPTSLRSWRPLSTTVCQLPAICSFTLSCPQRFTTLHGFRVYTPPRRAVQDLQGHFIPRRPS